MNLINQHPKWNEQEFLCFLLIYASSADMQISEDERMYIRKMLNPQKVSEIESEFNDLGDFEKLRVIEKYKGLFFPTQERKNELLTKLEKLFQIDGEYSTMEHNLFLMLKKLL
jgi:hypothetical protein